MYVIKIGNMWLKSSDKSSAELCSSWQRAWNQPDSDTGFNKATSLANALGGEVLLVPETEGDAINER